MINYKKSNYQDVIKLYALIIMFVDHIGFYFLPEAVFLRAIGRGAMPIFCFFVGYNFHGKLNYKLIGIGLLLYAFSSYFIHGSQTYYLNILISMFIGQLYLKLFSYQMNNFWNAYIHVIITASLAVFTFSFIEYGTMVISVMILGYIARHIPKEMEICAILCLCFSFIHSIFEFSNSYSLLDICIELVNYLIIYYMLSSLSLFANIKFRIAHISRNSLFIYALNVVVSETIWRYAYLPNTLISSL